MAIPFNASITTGSNSTGPLLNGNLPSPDGEPTLPHQPKTSTPEPIAICGIGLRLPGGIQNGKDFWELLINGRDARSEIPENRYAIDGFDASLSGQGAIPTRHGYFLDDDLSRLDTSFFSMSKNEIERCDPQQRLLLEVVRETFEDAGEVNYRGQAIGCYVGTFGQDWYEMTTKDVQSMGNYSMMGSGDLILANRVSYEFDLRGPSLVVKTGCSASLVALHDACRALQSGDSSAAIVCGTSLIITPTTTAAFFNEGVLSPDASCKTFDAAANGFARAEGITAVYIKRLDDALRDGNPIRAVIRNTGSNNDGRSQGLTSPNGEAHEALMRQVYHQAHLDPSKTAFVECHGTGTPVGDPTETRAVGNVFGDNGVYIGSVKPNVGHSEGSSGLTSLIKAVLALEHRTIPPNIKFQKPNPQIPFSEKKLVVPLKPTAFPKGRAERISINSFGIGGSNAHAILDSSTQYLHTPGPATNRVNGVNGHGLKTASRPDLLLFSANSTSSLRMQTDSFEEYTAQYPDSCSDAAYTLALHREHLPHRAFAIVQDGTICETSTQIKAMGSAPPITMVFSGQGAQWPQMGRELILTTASFRGDIVRMDETLQGLRIPPRWSILDELLKPEGSSQIHRAELAQPLSTALQIALVRHLGRLNITPSAVVGHSSGEIAAAYASGYISLEYAITLAYYRGYVSSHGNTALSGGAMAAIGLGASDVSRFLQPGVCVACENSPSSTTISGDSKAVQQALASVQLEYPEVLARTLKVDVAYHSHHMAALAAEYLDLLHGEDHLSSDGDQNEPGVVLFSSVTTKPIRNGTPLASPYYWVINLVSPVRFSDAVTNLLAHNRETNSSNILLEIGPHSALAGPLRQICEAVSQPCRYIPSQIRGKDSAVSFLSALGGLHQESVPINWQPLFPPGSKALAGLPTYPWDHSTGPFWYENRLSKTWRTRRFAQHCLLGTRVVETPDTAPQWRNVLNLENLPWLSDHKVRQDVVFPFAAYIAIAGEAVRQMTGGELGYRLRHVVARTALVLTDTEPVEMVTALRQQRLTDTDESTWFDFVIASYSGSTWVKHCEGQATALLQPSSPILTLQDDRLPRLVSNTRFYDAVLRAGLVFGPEFQRLAGISTSTTEGIAQAKVLEPTTETSRPFPGPLHPASIDACIQLLLLANVQGLVRNLRQLVVPTLIENIEIAHGSAGMNTKAVIPEEGLASASVECVTDDNRLALRMSGLQVTALDNDFEAPTRDDPIDIHAAARLHWLPDFDFAPLTDLIKPPASNQTERELNETLTLLCILESASQLTPLGPPAQPHHTKYLAWLNQQLAQAQSNTHPLIPNTTRYTTLPTTARRALLEETYSQLLALPGFHAGARGLKRISDHAAELFTGERDALDLLMQEDLLTEIYNTDAFDYAEFVRLLAHARPDLRVLEVGAGTGGTTELLLRGFQGLAGGGGGDDDGQGSGLPGYAEYMFTDVSAGFFPQARERFAWAPNMQFQALDISRDAAEQGFAAGSYDLIVAPNVVHATPCLRETLANLRPLLKDDGMLLLLELSTVMSMPTFIFGNFSGWWLGEEDGRVWEPYVLPERWDEELKAAGFTGADAAVADREMPWQMSIVMVSKPEVKGKAEPERKVTVLCQDPVDGPAESLIAGLRSEGWDATTCLLGELPPAGQDIISCVDLETRFFDQGFLTETNFAAFQELIRHLKNKDSRILWLTPPFQVRCRDPRGAQVLGVMRTIRAELGLPLFTLELDYESEAHHAAHLISEVFIKKVQKSQDGDILNTDREFAIDNGTVLLSRFHPFSLTDEQTQSPDNNTTTTDTTSPTSHQTTPETTKTLRIPQPGHLPSLTWTTTPLPTTTTPLPPDQVLIQIHSAALNFRDILLATGALPAPLSGGPIQLGYEASGTVLHTGATASARFRPGDRVLLLCPQSTLTTTLCVPAALVARIPDNMPLAAAAAVPVCFGTAMHALLEVGRLRPGMSVLVHSACGGVGLAALEVCRMVGGVEVFATVGSEEKVRWLVGGGGEDKGLGVRRERVFSSRDGGFLEGVLRETGGRGVDLVLNSLSGELLHASWGCVAKYGMLLELGKRDLVRSGRLDMAPFLANRTYAGVDLLQYLTERPEKITELLTQYVEMYEQGRLRLLDPISCFKADEVEQAFRHLQNAGHIGKVVVNMPDDPSSINSLPLTRSVTLDPEATYLLVGGAKGLGTSLSSWLVEHGARNLTFLSRSSGTNPESKALFEELRAMGCSVHVVVGSVENKEDIFAAALSSGRTIRGVFQLAMVMNDAPLLDMKWSDWNATVGPKVRGTWNLHDVLADQPLDFFWMASSIVTVADEAGQSNYSAGCIFLEAFCQYRHSLGLPATVVNICPIGGVGYVAENAHARRNIKAQGLYTLGEHEFLEFVQHNILEAGAKSNINPEAETGSLPKSPALQSWENPNQVVMGLRSASDLHLDDPNSRTNWRRDRRMGRYHNVRPDEEHKGSSAGANRLALFLDSIINTDGEGGTKRLADPEVVAFLAREIGAKIYELILKPVADSEEVDTRLTLAQIGLDSLMAIELRRWLRRVFGMVISVLEIMGSGSLIQLGGVVGGKLAEKLAKE